MYSAVARLNLLNKYIEDPSTMAYIQIGSSPNELAVAARANVSDT